ncbi:MAG: cytochrome c [Colwellia sp.]|nr:cytochrome c [Colwellia sp.]
MFLYSVKVYSVIIVFLFCSIFSVELLANTEQLGQSLYQQCAACHGVEGQGIEQLNTPAIAAQYSWYITRQLSNFSKDLRGSHKEDAMGKQMANIAKLLDLSTDLAPLSTYIESLPAAKVVHQTKVASPEHALKNGSRYYQAKCGACHGGQGQGNKSFNAPKLNILSSQYLLKQMENFSAGIRGTAKEDKFGRQMAMMAKTTSGQELEDIIYYLTTITNINAK